MDFRFYSVVPFEVFFMCSHVLKLIGTILPFILAIVQLVITIWFRISVSDTKTCTSFTCEIILNFLILVHFSYLFVLLFTIELIFSQFSMQLPYPSHQQILGIVLSVFCLKLCQFSFFCC